MLDDFSKFLCQKFMLKKQQYYNHVNQANIKPIIMALDFRL